MHTEAAIPAQDPKQLDRALALNEGAIELQKRVHGGQLVSCIDLEEAIRLSRSAANSQTQVALDKHAQPLLADFALGRLRAARGDRTASRDACARALAADNSDPAEVYENHIARCVGEAELALGDVADARKHLKRSVAFARRGDRYELVRARLSLARALSTESAGGVVKPTTADLARARDLAVSARDELRNGGTGRPDLAPVLDLAERTCRELTL